MEKTIEKASGGRIVHRPDIVSLSTQREVNKFFNSKSLTICKPVHGDAKLIINRKLAKKLELDGSNVKITLFPDISAVIIGKNIPFKSAKNYVTYDSDAVFVEDAQLVNEIIESVGVDFENCIAKAFRKICYQRVGDSYMATVFLK